MDISEIAVWGIWGFLALSLVIFLVFFFIDYAKAKKEDKIEKEGNNIIIAITAFLTQFFDTLGIGSFAPMTSAFRSFKLVRDQVIPGTLNAAACTCVITEAIIFIKTVQVEPLTLVLMLGAALAGAVLMAGIVSKLPEKKIQVIMSITLFILALVMVASQLKLMPIGGEATGLSGSKLIIGVVGNFILGALMTVGVGLYAPCMALVYMLGMSPAVAFPIMMGSCAVLMPFASLRFIKEGAYNRKVTMLFLVPGIIGVLIAAFIVKSMNIYWLTWLVIVVLLYTAVSMFLTFLKNKKANS